MVVYTEQMGFSDCDDEIIDLCDDDNVCDVDDVIIKDDPDYPPPPPLQRVRPRTTKTVNIAEDIKSVSGQLWRTSGRMQREKPRSSPASSSSSSTSRRTPRKGTATPASAKTLDQLKQDIHVGVEEPLKEIKAETSDDLIATHLVKESTKLVEKPQEPVVTSVPFVFGDFRKFVAEKLTPMELANGEIVGRLDPLGSISLAEIPRSQQSTRSQSSSSSSSSSCSSSSASPLEKTVPLPYPVFIAPVELIYAYIKSIPSFEAEAALPRRVAPLPAVPHACPRKHVEAMLVGVHGNAKPCMFDESCVCNVEYKFIMREYISPEEYRSGQKKSTTERNPCYICFLVLIFTQYIYQSNQSSSAMLKIQLPFYHIVNQPGEYRTDVLIPPISSSIEDTKTTDLRCQTPLTSTENTYGLTEPMVAFKTNNYTMSTTPVRVDGKIRHVPCLKESERMLFTEHSQAIAPLPQVAPFQYIRTEEHYTPSTVHIMNGLFSEQNEEHVIGAARMRNYGQYIDPANRIKCLPYRWCNQAKGNAQRFPWRFIFDTDIRVTVSHLDEIVEKGCIDIDYIFRNKRSTDLNIIHDQQVEGWYAQKLRKEIYACRLYYVAYRVRMAVLITLLRVYPQSKNSNRDITVKRRTEILNKWNLQNYHPVIKRDTFDVNVDTQQIRKIAAREPETHYFPEDDVHRKFTRTIVCRQTPREYLLEWLGSEYARVLEPFRELKDNLQNYHSHRRAHLSYFGQIATNLTDEKYFTDDEELLNQRGYSILAAVYVRVNWASQKHDSMEQALLTIEENYRRVDAECAQGISSLNSVKSLDSSRRIIRERRYMLRLFILTHLDIIARARKHKNWSDAFFMQRVPHVNLNYCMRHYDEVEPWDTRVYHEGILPDISQYMCCVPFPDQKDAGVKENNTSTNHLFRMIGLLLPRIYAIRTNNKQHIKLCNEHAAYRKLSAMVVMVSFTGAYRHADYLPPLEHCLHIREVMMAPNSEKFENWQRCFKSLAVLAMREYVVFQVKMCLPHHYYLVHQHPYWVQYARQTYALSNVVRLATREKHGLSSIQYDVQIIVKPKSNDIGHFDPQLGAIITKLVGTDCVIDWSRSRHELQVDELRTLCRHLYMINITRARTTNQRMKMPRHLNYAIIAKVYSIPRQSPIDLEWLLEFNFDVEYSNVSKLTIELLEYAFYFILMGPQKSTNVTIALSAIPLRDYEIVDAFFFNLFTHYSINVTHLSDPDIARRQYEAVLRRNDLTEKDVAVSPWAMSLMFAPCCGTIRSYITQEEGALLYGGNKVCIDPFSNSVVCGVKTEYDNQKKSYRVHTLLDRKLREMIMMPQRELGFRRICRRIMKLVSKDLHNRFYQQPKCGDIPLVAVNLIGRIAQVTMPKVSRTSLASPTTNAFTICERCGGIMLFSTKFYGANGLCCQECCMAHTVETHTPMCVAKRHRIKLDTPVHVFHVIDDRPVVGTQMITRMYVCHRCYTRKTAGYVENAKQILCASGLARTKHFLDTSMNFDVALASGENLNEYFNPKLSNYTQRARVRLDKTLNPHLYTGNDDEDASSSKKIKTPKKKKARV